MKLLLDANISRELVKTLNPIFGDCAYADSMGLNISAVDMDIWNYTLSNEYIIVTKDSDFLNLLELKGFPPKIVLLKTGNNSSTALFELLKNNKPMIEDLENNNYGLLEILKK